MKKIIKALVIGRSVTIDVVKNDMIDYKAGGPHYLGYDFIVDADEDPKEVEMFVKNIFNNLNKSYLNIWVSPNTVEVDESNIWTQSKILDCITNEIL